MLQQHDTIIIGGGQAGLAASYYLTQQNRDHAILEKKRIGETWRSGKWDSFTLVTPNHMLQLPGFAYEGEDSDGFLTRDEVVKYLEDYVDKFDPLIRTGVEVSRVREVDIENKFLLETNIGEFVADNLIVATGTFQFPDTPEFASKLPSHIKQLHSSEYKNPDTLPEGAVLVVGSAQSGCQIADELNENGREVFLCTGSANRLPRRYRGHDSFWWAEQLGIMDQTPDDLPSPKARFMPNPQVSGKNGGKTLGLHQLAQDGVQLLGRLKDINGTNLSLGEDLMDNLAQADKFAVEFKQGVDQYIEKTDMQVPESQRPVSRAGYEVDIITRLDLEDEGITSVIWATGYNYDYSWIDFPVFDDVGYPVTERGVTEQPGLYFVGLHFLDKRKSGLLLGVGDDAAHVTEHIATHTKELVSES
ncbi:MAG: flavin-containing monooxygenase [Anaerolineae bacterium]